MSKIFSPFIAIDLETTGLASDEGAQILELCMRFEDFGLNGLVDTKILHLYIKHDEVNWANDDVKEMNKHVFSKCERVGVSLDDARSAVKIFIEECVELNKGYATSYAAKNANTLVLAMLKKSNFDVSGILYRCLDVPSMYYMDFGYVPTFQQIGKKLNMSPGNTLADVSFIVTAIQNKVFRELGI
jgi:oligoribonuclease (3'-5' exoribonuclease)